MKKNYSPRKVHKYSTGRRLAIGDIHGCCSVFEKLLWQQLKITPKDQIFLLGDMIDKGPNSAKVLDLILSLQKEGYQIFPIMGNHERKLLLAYQCGFDFFEDYLISNNSSDLLGDDLEKYLGWIHRLDYCIVLDNFVLSPPGINQNGRSPFTDLRGTFPEINFVFNEKELVGKIQIHGHSVKTIAAIRQGVDQQEKRLSIDSGCHLDSPDYGYLTALDVDQMSLYHQKHIHSPHGH